MKRETPGCGEARVVEVFEGLHLVGLAEESGGLIAGIEEI